MTEMEIYICRNEILGPCHQYVQQRKRTGGWTDVWCPHNIKVASKMEARQETVSNPSDVVHSMKKLPVLHILVIL